MLSHLGGTESWHQLLIGGLVGAPEISVVGVAVLDAPNPDAMALPCPVQYGAEALRSLAASVDVLILWGMAHPENYGVELPQQVIAVVHGDANHEWTRSVNAGAAPSIDLFVAVAQSATNAIPAQSRRVVIDNGIAPEFFDRALSARRGGPMTLGFMARLSPEKRPLEFLDLAAEVGAACRIRALMIGGGQMRGEVLSKAEELGIDLELTQTHSPSETAQQLSRCDIFVSLSDCEGDGLARKQALAKGVPVATTPTGSALEWPHLVELMPFVGSPDWLEFGRSAVLRAMEHELERRLTASFFMARRYGHERFVSAWKTLILNSV